MADRAGGRTAPRETAFGSRRRSQTDRHSDCRPAVGANQAQVEESGAQHDCGLPRWRGGLPALTLRSLASSVPARPGVG